MDYHQFLIHQAVLIPAISWGAPSKIPLSPEMQPKHMKLKNALSLPPDVWFPQNTVSRIHIVHQVSLLQ